MRLAVPDGTIVDVESMIYAEEGEFSPFQVNAFLNGQLTSYCEWCKVGKNGYVVIVTDERDETGEELIRITKYGDVHLESIE